MVDLSSFLPCEKEPQLSKEMSIGLVFENKDVNALS